MAEEEYRLKTKTLSLAADKCKEIDTPGQDEPDIHPNFPYEIWVVVEQLPGERFRNQYEPESNTFYRLQRESLFYRRTFKGAYGWVYGLGTPPAPHLDVILLTNRSPKIGDVINGHVHGILRKEKDDHKIIAIDSGLWDGTRRSDPNELDKELLRDIKNVYKFICDEKALYSAGEAIKYLKEFSGAGLQGRSWKGRDLREYNTYRYHSPTYRCRQNPEPHVKRTPGDKPKEFFVLDQQGHKVSQVAIDVPSPFGVLKTETRRELTGIGERLGVNPLSLKIQTPREFLYPIQTPPAWLYALSKGPGPYCEYNPDVEIRSPEYGFWSAIEIEYKIDILTPQKMRGVLESIQFNGFAHGPVTTEKSFERYKMLRPVNVQVSKPYPYIAILGNRNSRRPMAIKCKKTRFGKILTRKVQLLPFNEANLKEAAAFVMGHQPIEVNLVDLPAFWKTKSRVVIVDKKLGYVYCLSYNIAIPLRRSGTPFSQIEIEYWSKLVPENLSPEDKSMKQNLYESYDRLIQETTAHLERTQVKYSSPGRTKYDWLSTL